eukprot:TRINITY_DN742_c0_g2_i2.p1 TRINITY_DN742_c0_g2~~TRINITY_DN742_c0_g2_i2.p1  ORF type:complete len:466 (+),score=25.08 TRINITY_DN742_c0_g2_i2:26-1423(+)
MSALKIKEEHSKKLSIKKSISPITPKLPSPLHLPDSPLSLSDQLHLQPNINIGTIGHVAHGKSTLVKSLSGKKTQDHSSEHRNNDMTIKLGYANCKIWQCPKCPRPECYSSSGSDTKGQKCEHCFTECVLVRHVSFVDCPGHDGLMATMLNGAAVMDAALLVLAANEKCPQPQAEEHLIAAEIMKLDKFLICQNKIDLLPSMDKIREHKNLVAEFVKGTAAAKAPICPVSAQFRANLDVVCQFLAQLETPIVDLAAAPFMTIVRSFDINKPGSNISDLKGGVVGGTLTQGKLEIGQEIEIRPGWITRGADGQIMCRPHRSFISSLYSEKTALRYAVPGGLIAVGLELDPAFTRDDGLVGQTLGIPGSLPSVYTALTLRLQLLKRIVGDATVKIKRPKTGDELSLNVGASTVKVTISAVSGREVTVGLQKAVCVRIGQQIAISRQIMDHYRLIGIGIVKAGTSILD